MVRLSILGAILIRLKACDVAYIGLREVDPEEAKIIQDLDMQAFSMQDVDLLGIREVRFLLLIIMYVCIGIGNL